jgi:hypothetical protein
VSTPTTALVSSGRAEALKGMFPAHPFTVPAGQVIYRFYDRTRATSPERGANGAWWFEFEHFQTIRHFAARHGHTLGYAARLFAAVLYEWSEVDGFVACKVVAPLSAWKGRGRQVASTGKDARDLPRMTPMQGPLEVYQLYVPAIGGADHSWSRALQLQSHGLA